MQIYFQQTLLIETNILMIDNTLFIIISTINIRCKRNTGKYIIQINITTIYKYI